MGIWYSVLTDFFGNMLFFYIPCVHLLRPRHKSRYGTYAVSVLLFTAWGIPWRYWVSLPSVFPYLISNYIFLWLLLRVLSRDSGKRVLLGWILLIALGFFTDAICMLFMSVLETNFFSLYIGAVNDWSYLTVARILGLLAGGFVNTMSALVYLCLIRRKNPGIFCGFLLIPIYQVFLMGAFFQLCSDFSERGAAIGLVMGIFNVMLDGVVLYLLDGIFRKMDREAELLKLEELRRREYEFYASDSSFVEEMRLIRHDFSNQLQAMYGMLDDPDSADRVKRMLEEMQKRLGEDGN